MLVFMNIARPAVRLLRNSAAAILRGFDSPITERSAVHSPEELKLIATAARRLGLLPPFQETLVHRALELDGVPVREIMTPRQKIFSLPSNMTLEEAGARVIARHHSRIPVYDESRGPEHIVGVVYFRDLARLLYYRTQNPIIVSEGQRVPPAVAESGLAGREEPLRIVPTGPRAELRLSQIMREVLVVPETKSILDLIREFQQRRRHLAVAVDEYGSIVGLVTAEDAIEQLTGEFEDEFDAPSHPVLTTAGGAVVMDGSVNLRDLETQMQWNLPRDGGVETLAGFLLYRLGHIPQVGESIVFDDRRLTVVEMDARRIAKVRAEPVTPAAEPAS
jgi:putative hemolysin